MDQPQNILSVDICSTAGSQIQSDLAEALELLRELDTMGPGDTIESWRQKAASFVDRFPDFPPAS